MIKFQNIIKTYMSKQGPISALRDVNLQVETSKIVDIIGKMVQVKSTLMYCVNLLE